MTSLFICEAPGCNIGRFAQCQVFVPLTTVHFTHHHRSRMDANPHGEFNAIVVLQARIERAYRLDNTQSGMDSTRRIAFVSRRKAKID
jgi:hypothetical protein